MWPIIKSNMKYTETLTLFKVTTLHERKTQLRQKFFQGILNPKHKLYFLLGDVRNVLIELRKPNIFLTPKAKTNQFKDSLVCYGFKHFKPVFGIQSLSFCRKLLTNICSPPSFPLHNINKIKLKIARWAYNRNWHSFFGESINPSMCNNLA